MKLQESRKKIDAINKELIHLFEERLRIVVDIAKYKEEHQMKIHDVQREQEILATAVQALENPELADYAKEFMNEVIRISKDYEKNHIHQHIFLIGMPGAGKTTIGKALAQALGLEFFDVDTEIQERTGKSIQNIIIHDGEDEFHQLELNVIQDLVSKKNASVIATGGGTVLCDATAELMRESGYVVLIQRDVKQILDDLDMEIRPLLKESIEYIFRLYEERQPIYERVSHIKIENISNVADVVQAVISALPNASL